MRIRIISYSAKGRETAAAVSDILKSEGHDTETFALAKYCAQGDIPLTKSAQEWAKESFSCADALIFCCASGIAVRAIAPSVRDKTTDPAVIVIDELGRYAIPLLSGHIGGANELSLLLENRMNCTAVITTATDINGLFAVDVFASRNHLYISSMQLAKEVSAALLRKEDVGFCSDFPVEGKIPAELHGVNPSAGILITRDLKRSPFEKTLRLIPQRYCAGIGCKRGKSAEELEAFLLENLSSLGIHPQEVRCIASIDLKKEEAGLLDLCGKYRFEFRTFSAQELMKAQGEFSMSDFVKAQTGVDCVCERAAVTASGGKLIQHKTAANGMTFALAQYEEAIRFE